MVSIIVTFMIETFSLDTKTVVCLSPRRTKKILSVQKKNVLPFPIPTIISLCFCPFCFPFASRTLSRISSSFSSESNQKPNYT